MHDWAGQLDVHQWIDPWIDSVLEQAGISEPPVDAVRIAQSIPGLTVPCVENESQRKNRRGMVLVPQEDSQERLQRIAAMAVAGHYRSTLLERSNQEREGVLSGESLTTLFARRLLLPSCWFMDLARQEDGDLLALKTWFSTASLESIAWRLLDLPAATIITLIDNGQISRRKSNSGWVKRELVEPERYCLEQVQRYSRPFHCQQGSWRVQGWAIPRLDWRREILRSQYDPYQ